MSKKNAIIIIAAVLIVAGAITVAVLKNVNDDKNLTSSESGLTQYYNEEVSGALNSNIKYDAEDEEENYAIDTYITIENGQIKTSGKKSVSTQDGTILITEAGNYSVSGNYENTSIKISVGKDDVVKILLDSATITSKNTSAIYMESGDKCIVTAKSGTKNVINDASSYADTSDEAPKAAIYSKGDLVINGSGTLTVNGNYKDALSTSDKLRIFSISLNIQSEDDGIRGKDYVYIKDATIKISSNGDGIKSTNEESDEVGFIVLENADLTIKSESDAIDAQSSLYISGGNYDITTGEGSSVSYSNKAENFKMYSNSSSSEDETSKKGLKAKTNITIDGGKFTFDTEDDSIHSNNIVNINSGEFNIKSADDGVHADTELYIKSADMTISKSYEGLESLKITIDDGNFDITASDDAVNVAGGNDMSSISGRPGQNNFNINNSSLSDNSQFILTINGGNVVVNSEGDGLDSNGSIYINGGNIVVYGPTNDANGALDYDRECTIKGGELVAIGSSGMMQATSSNSSQNTLAYVFDANYNAGSSVIIKDSSGEEVINVTPNKKFSSIVFSSEKLKEGQTYSILVDGKTAGSLTISGTVTSNSNMQMNGGVGNPNMQGGRGMRSK